MPDDVVERLFSLFTSADRAEAITGDLIQERPDRGWTWFWCHAFAAAVTFWGTAVAEAPARTLLVVAAGCTLMAGPAFAGVAAVTLFPTISGAILTWSLLAIFWWGGALWAGASMVVLAPARGMAAGVTLAVLGDALLLALWVAGLPIDVVNLADGITHLTAAGAAWPLLVGAAIARSRQTPWTRAPMEQHS
jgi:hypothetical protein